MAIASYHFSTFYCHDFCGDGDGGNAGRGNLA
jgi:hypothetical protein